MAEDRSQIPESDLHTIAGECGKGSVLLSSVLGSRARPRDCFLSSTLTSTFILIICFPLLLQADPLQGEALLVRANGLYRQGRFEQAIRIYEKALDRGGNPARCSFNIGNASFQLKAYGKAIRAYHKAIDYAPEFVRPYINVAGVYSLIGEKGLGVVYFRHALALDPDNRAALRSLGDTFMDIGNVAEAIRCYEQTIALGPNEIGSYYAMAEAHLSVDDAASAEKVIREAIERNPQVLDLWTYLGDLHYYAEDYGKAALSFQEAAGLQPENAGIRFRIADSFMQEGNTYTAVKYLDDAVELDPSFEQAHFLLGTLHFNEGWMDRSLRHYVLAARLGNREARSGIRNISYHHHNRDDNQRFIEVTQQLLALYPGDPQALQDLAEARQRTGQVY